MGASYTRKVDTRALEDVSGKYKYRLMEVS